MTKSGKPPVTVTLAPPKLRNNDSNTNKGTSNGAKAGAHKSDTKSSAKPVGANGIKSSADKADKENEHVPEAQPRLPKQESTVRQLWVDKHKPMSMAHLVGNGDKVTHFL